MSDEQLLDIEEPLLDSEDDEFNFDTDDFNPFEGLHDEYLFWLRNFFTYPCIYIICNFHILHRIIKF